MLQLVDVCKSYTTADFTQVALDHVSLAFRDNEFVAILGPSGSGKTTTLNIIGGLDHYDTGDLIIDGVSTRQYKDRDWDAYRNNRIGFVFQAYNLIPHQTILQNVELALTLSGVSRDERRRRAKEALAKVGLDEHVNKKPSQLSGGQMQRVAIARALINDPEILLADEPTGALDSKTSVQIMDLLTEIANDRLVIMVTHNPELAEQYATRIVNLADGQIKSDTDPFDPAAEGAFLRAAKPVRRTSMSFFTALSLSFKNLMTKKGRTIMTAFAGSIGIIGIAAILSLANGVNGYIKSVEEDTLSEYPLSIESSGFDMTSMMAGSMGTDDGGDGSANANANANGNGDDNAAENGTGNATADKPIHESKMVSGMFGSIGSNDLASLKSYLDSGESDIDQYTSSIEYGYDVTPQIFNADTSNGAVQVNPDKSFSSLGLGSAGAANGIMSSMMSTNIFYELPQDMTPVQQQYDVVAGHWPENANEVVVVLTPTGNVSDFMLYAMGLRDRSELTDMVTAFANEQPVNAPTDRMALGYDDLLNVKFKLVNSADFYEYDADYGVWKDKTSDDDYMTDLVNDGEDVTVAGIVQAKPEAKISSLSPGIYYPTAMVNHLIDTAATTQIVQDQLADSTKNVFSGKSFAEDNAEQEGDGGFDMSSLFTVDEQAIQNAFKIDESALTAGMSGAGIDLSGLAIDPSALPAFDASALALDPSVMDLSGLQLDFSDVKLTLGDVQPAVDSSKLSAGIADVLQGFFAWLREHPDAIDPTAPGGGMDAAMQQYMQTEEVQAKLAAAIAGAVDTSAMQGQIEQVVQEQLAPQISAKVQEQLVPALSAAVQQQLGQRVQTALQTYMQTTMTALMTQMTSTLEQQVNAAMQQSMGQLSANMANALSIDAGAFQNAFQMNMDQEELTELMVSMMTTEEASYDNNLKKLGYADYAKPASIDIYPKDFESKEQVINILDAYNQQMKDSGQKEKAVTYTDIVGALMSSVTTIVNMISYMLIAFVAISLVVSSIMIGIITYISVLERKKEIGILRSIGASKGDVSRVFNAETIIVGLAAGLIGIGVTALGCIPASAIVYSLFDVPNIASLPWQAAIVLVLISVGLSFIAGLLPSSAASRKDPVEALRSE